MKKILSLILVAFLALSCAACGKSSDGGQGSADKKGDDSSKTDVTSKEYLDKGVIGPQYCVEELKEDSNTAEVDKKAAALLKEILDNPDTVKANGGKTYYVSTSGNDVNDGLSEDTALASIDAVNKLNLSAGDCVLFKRGDLWRGAHLQVMTGVSYGAYGSGDKPKLYGTEENAKDIEWNETDTPNVYLAKKKYMQNVGCIVLNEGEDVAMKVGSKDDLTEDGLYYYDDLKKQVLLRSDKGNPSDVYYDIEIMESGHVISTKSGSTADEVTIQNLTIMYSATHGIGVGSSKNFRVDGCVIGYIGGAKHNGSTGEARLGNGIEIWGTCDGYYINKCYVYQCYDAGITMQYITKSTEKTYEQNIHFTNNLLDYSVYNIEYFINGEGDYGMKDVEISNNIIRRGGYGWGYEARPNKNNGTNVQGISQYNKAENFVFRDNIFDRANSFLVNVSAGDTSWLPTFEGNTFVQYSTGRTFKHMGKNYGTNKGIDPVKDVLGDKTATLITIEK